MNQLLFIKASPRQDESNSGNLAEKFVEKWLKSNPDAKIIRRDVSPGKVAGPDQEWVEANIEEPEKRTEEQKVKLKQSDEYIKELHDASHVVISTPMYNFSIPWNLKAYIDNIVREGETFKFSIETSHGPLLNPDKKLLLVSTAAGDYSPGSEMGEYDLLTPTIATTYGFMGIMDFSVIHAGNREEAPELAEATMKKCLAQVDEISEKW